VLFLLLFAPLGDEKKKNKSKKVIGGRGMKNIYIYFACTFLTTLRTAVQDVAEKIYIYIFFSYVLYVV